VVCRDFSVAAWQSSYKDIYGVVRGSAAPVRDGEGFLVIAHSSYKAAEGRRYAACFYRFEASAPFRMLDAPAAPFDLPNPNGLQFQLPKLNRDVGEVIYPCGFVVENETAVVSYGINDESCAVARASLSTIRGSMESASNAVTLTLNSGSAGDLGQTTPTPLRARKPPALPLFWWDAKGKQLDPKLRSRVFRTGNFGDIASADMVQRITRRRVRAPRPNERKLLTIGSVLHTARDGDVIWGTGAKGGKTTLAKGIRTLSVHAVRGPLTLDVLRTHRIDVSNVKQLFDPGCLLPLLYAEQVGQLSQSVRSGSKGYRIVPHYRDDLLMRRRYWRHLQYFVPVDTTPTEFIDAIYGAERVISSSLHGIIFAEALGIPACWLAPEGGEDERKYYDYYYGTGRWAVKRFESVEDALRSEPMPLPKFLFEDYLATFPHDEVAQLGLPGIHLDEPISFLSLAEDDFTDCIDAWNFAHLGKNGVWSTANRSRLQSYVNGCRSVSTVELEISLRPFNPTQFLAPQRIEVTLNGHARHVVDWCRGSEDQVRLIIRTPHDGSDRCFVDLLFEARNVRSPKSLGLADIRQPLGVCIKSITARPAMAVVAKQASAA
jgi:hypothetical protein